MTRPHETDADRAVAFDDVMTAPGGTVLGLLDTSELVEDDGEIRFTSRRAVFHCNTSALAAAAVVNDLAVTIDSKTETGVAYKIADISNDADGGARVRVYRSG